MSEDELEAALRRVMATNPEDFAANRLLDHLAQGYRLPAQLDLPRVDPRQVQQIVDEAGQVRDLPLDAAGHVADSRPGADEQHRLHERDRQLAAAVGALPERQRAAIALTYQEGLSNAEVAQVLDISVSSVEALLVRARRALRAVFESN